MKIRKVLVCGPLISLLLCLNTPAQSQTLWPSAEDWQRSVVNAALSPITWVPLVGAALIWATNTDRSISNWASENTPIFGSQSTAESDSTRLRNILGGVAAVSTIISPPQMKDESVIVEKVERFGVMIVATGVASEITNILKHTIKRERPNGSNDLSFPSGNATQAFSFAAVTTRNLDDFHFSYGLQILQYAVVYTTAALASWARVEADLHYPTDILVGAAIGNFVTSTIFDAFVGVPDLSVSVSPQRGGGSVNLGMSF